MLRNDSKWITDSTTAFNDIIFEGFDTLKIIK